MSQCADHLNPEDTELDQDAELAEVPDTELGPPVRPAFRRRITDRHYSSTNLRLFTGLSPEELRHAMTSGWLSPIAAARMVSGYHCAQVRLAWPYTEVRVAMLYAALRRAGVENDAVAAHVARQVVTTSLDASGQTPVSIQLTPGVVLTITEDWLSREASAPRAPRLERIARKSGRRVP